MTDLWKALGPYLGVREGMRLVPVTSGGRGGTPELLETHGAERRRFLVMHAVVEEGQPPHRTLLRMQAAEGEGRTAASRELQDLGSSSLPEHGTTRLDDVVGVPVQPSSILPPVFFCRQKGEWILAICPRCSGKPGSLTELPVGKDCPVCGSGRDAGEPQSPQAPKVPLEALWSAVQDSLKPGWREATETARADRLPLPLCVRCERNRTCFPTTGSPTHPKGAVEALFPVMQTSWSGAPVRAFDLPLAGWVDVLGGTALEHASGVGALPASVVEPVRTRLGEGPRRLVPGDFAARAGGEGMLLRLVLLRQLLEGLRGVRAGLGHPHLDVRPDTIWVAVGHPSAMSPSTWNASLQLIDLAAGWHHPTEASRASMGSLPDYPDELVPPQGRARVTVPGMLVPRGETVEEEGRLGVRFLFLPEEGSSEAPGENEPVIVALMEEGRTKRTFSARVEVAFKDVYRLVLFSGDLAPEDLDGVLKGATTVVRLGGDEVPADPDLYAAGTVWLAMLGHNGGDLVAAATLRDAMLRVLDEEGVRRNDHRTAERICLRAGLAAGKLFHEAARDMPGPESALLGRSLWLGLRLCGASQPPGGAGRKLGEARNVIGMFDNLLRETDALIEEARYIMLGRSTSEEEILGVLRSYEAERAGR